MPTDLFQCGHRSLEAPDEGQVLSSHPVKLPLLDGLRRRAPVTSSAASRVRSARSHVAGSGGRIPVRSLFVDRG
jgi:hypothetical protein